MSTEDGKDPPFLQPWPRAAGDPQEGQAALGVGGRLGAHCSPEFQLQVSLSPEITSHAVMPGTPPARNLTHHQPLNKKTLSLPAPPASPPSVSL